MSRLLITGANGQLGCAIKTISEEYKMFRFFYADLPELDISQPESVRRCIRDVKPSAIINCAAYTAVDEAEFQQDQAFLINAEGVKILSDVSEKEGIRLIHISTDYVFDGLNYKPYTETDVPNPQTTYGKSKLKGEEFLRDNHNSMIIRTSWLYSDMPQSFYRKILNAATENSGIKVVYDQTGSPTYAEDLAKAIMEIMSGVDIDAGNFIPGIYHFSNEGIASWFDFATEIIENAGIDCNVIPVESDEYPVKTPRPYYSVLSKKKIKTTYRIQIPHWKESLKKLMNEL